MKQRAKKASHNPPPPRKAKKLSRGEQKARIGVLMAECDALQLSQPQRYAHLVSAGMDKRAAARYSGYSPSTSSHQIEQSPAVQAAFESIDQIRETLSRTPGYTFRDSAEWYQRKSNLAEQDADAIRARTRLDTLMGYDAPKEINVTERSERVQVSALVVQLAGGMGLTPRELSTAIAQAPQAVECVGVRVGGEERGGASQ